MNRNPAAMPQQEDYFLEEETIDLRHYWRVLMRFKWGILGLGFLTALVTALVLITKDDIYEATATLLIESNQPNITTIEQLYGIEAQSREYYNTQFELLRNRLLAERVIREMNLLSHPEFVPPVEEAGFSLTGFLRGLLPVGDEGEALPVSAEVARQQLLSRVVSRFDSRLTVTPVRNTDLVNIVFESTDPRLAADLANTLANAYIENNLEQRLAATQQASAWMSERLSDLKDSLDAAEKRLQDFREAENLVDIEGSAALNIQELDELTTQNNDARRRLSEAETFYRQVQSLEGASTEELLSIPAVLNHPLLARVVSSLNDVDQQLADLSRRYGRNHPRMIALNAQKEEITRNLASQVQQVVRTIETDYRTAVDNERLTGRRLEAAKLAYQDVNRKGFELRELQREVDTNRQLYDMFFTRLRETDQADGFQAVNALIVDPAVPALSPSKPRRSLITAIALMAGLMAGVMLAFLRDMLDNTVHSPAEIEERLEATTLGIIPFAKDNLAHARNKHDKTAYLGFQIDSRSNFSEAFRTIRTGLMLSALDQPYKLIGVTSSVPNEGKTTVSVNLASVLGQMKKTLLIDADMRRPLLARSLGLDAHAPGLSNIIAGTAEVKDCIIQHKEGNFYLLPCGQMVANPLELISSNRFRNFLEKLKENFEYIVIDTPPTQAVSDALMIGSITDATVYVVKADSTPINVIKTGLNRLRYANANIIGIALNQVDTEKQSYYPYYGGYYDDYGYSGKRQEA